MKNIGLLGGTFDPVHKGHIELADFAIKECGLSEVVFIPSAVPPHKNRKYVTSFHHRVEMLKIALKNRENYCISEIEAVLDPPSYTIDTLNLLQTGLKKAQEYYFIIGIDAFIEIHSWKQYEKVLKAVNFLVFARPGYDLSQLKNCVESFQYKKSEKNWEDMKSGKSVTYLEAEISDVSSSEIRAMLRNDEDTGDMVSHKVKEYIKRCMLYTSR